MRLALTVEYDGTAYHGFQYQGSIPTIQEELEKAVNRFTRESVRIKAAGRTDSGVHAEGQVVAFDTKTSHTVSKYQHALNFYLPEDISVREVYKVSEDFDPRRDATSRRYRYTILNRESRSPLRLRSSHLVKQRLDFTTMREGAKCFVGTHDFAGFSGPLANGTSTTVRKIMEVAVNESGELFTVDIEGNAFLPHQVRRMVGALVDLSRGKMTKYELRQILDRDSNGQVAHSLPPQGLCLMNVKYSKIPLGGGEIK